MKDILCDFGCWMINGLQIMEHDYNLDCDGTHKDSWITIGTYKYMRSKKGHNGPANIQSTVDINSYDIVVYTTFDCVATTQHKAMVGGILYHIIGVSSLDIHRVDYGKKLYLKKQDE